MGRRGSTGMMNFGEIRQLGHVVPDIDDAMAFWTGKMNVGPFFVMRDIQFTHFYYRGQSVASPRVSIAIAYSGEVQIELIQQLDKAPSAYNEFLSAGRSGLHHYSTWFAERDEYERTRSWALDAGFNLVMECRPDNEGRLAYFETGNIAAPLLELSEALAPSAEPLLRAVHQASCDWDGSDPVRMIEGFGG